ncbi:DUF6221 family protein [Streptomyces tremellae]|uniref:Uncharacterized protein n=1 Tax=Streptomyces tremellae TaxID=1124239 RepID=A0ABP7EHF7_9ACTN
MSDTADLIAFVRARLDEESAAIEAPETWTAFEENEQTGTRRVDVDYSFERVVACTRSWRGVHIERQDPARTLRRIAAQRAILDAYEAAAAAVDTPENLVSSHWQGDSGYVNGLWFAVEQTAAIYSDHPDYQARWGSAFLEQPE